MASIAQSNTSLPPWAYGETRAEPVNILARFAFVLLYYVSLVNLTAISSTANREMGVVGGPTSYIYPGLFLICSVVILALTTPRDRSVLMNMLWVYFLVYFFGGFVSGTGVGNANPIQLAQNIIKPAMSVVGLPWLALRAVSKEKLAGFLRGTVLITALVTTLGLIQVVDKDFLDKFVVGVGRAASLWVNPNHMGAMCCSVLMLSMICPFRRSWLTLICRSILILGTLGTFSRAATLSLLLGWIVYGIASKKITTLLKSFALIGVFVLFALFGLLAMDNILVGDEDRIRSIVALISLDFSQVDDNRTGLWEEALRQIFDDGGAILGFGHGRMLSLEGSGIASHNYFLHTWGTAGILSLVCFLVLSVLFFTEAAKCIDRNTRAGLMAISAIFVLTNMTDHSYIGSPFQGAIYGAIVVTAYYGQRVPNLFGTEKPRKGKQNLPAQASRMMPQVRPGGAVGLPRASNGRTPQVPTRLPPSRSPQPRPTQTQPRAAQSLPRATPKSTTPQNTKQPRSAQPPSGRPQPPGNGQAQAKQPHQNGKAIPLPNAADAPLPVNGESSLAAQPPSTMQTLPVESPPAKTQPPTAVDRVIALPPPGDTAPPDGTSRPKDTYRTPATA
ncbi:MAG: hypothetical protein SGJ20_03565 [Planctomycetota bacterium]|nr:hypothetical protein [Planctomycetota bacterium]